MQGPQAWSRHRGSQPRQRRIVPLHAPSLLHTKDLKKLGLHGFWPQHFLVQELPSCASRTGFGALFGFEQRWFEAAARTVDKWLEGIKRGAPHIRDGRYM